MQLAVLRTTTSPVSLSPVHVIFDPATVACGKEVVVHDFPAGGWRIKEEAEGVHATIVCFKL